VDFKILEKGMILKVSSGHGLALQLDSNMISDRIRERYKDLIKNEKLYYLYPDDKPWEYHKAMQVFVSLNEKQKATEISREQLLVIIESLTESSVVYTGAGISRAADIMTFDELSDMLCINRNRDSMVEAVIERSEYILAQFKMFSIRLKIAPPTVAHVKIAEMVKKYKCRFYSENLDELQQKTGIKPIFANDNIEALMREMPDKVLLLGVGNPMCSSVFDKWYEEGADFYAVNRSYTEINVPVKIYVGDIQEFFAG
jgi:hypothetical protein